MNIIYCGNQTKYGTDIFEVMHMVQSANADLTALNEQFEIVAQKTVVVEGGMVEAPFGTPHAVVIDNTDTEVGAVVRVKGIDELKVDAQEDAGGKLDAFTEEKIKSVCDSDRQKSLSLMYNTMSAENKTRAEVYFNWHQQMLQVHYAQKDAIALAADAAAVDAVVAGFEEAFATLMANAPIAEVDLSSYIA